jgi:hypothetical protein
MKRPSFHNAILEAAWQRFMPGVGNVPKHRESFFLGGDASVSADVEAVTGYGTGFDENPLRSVLYVYFTDGFSYRRLAGKYTRWRRI